LTLDDIDWKRERVAIPERKAGHSTAFPLSVVGSEALVDDLRHGRPTTNAPTSSSERSLPAVPSVRPRSHRWHATTFSKQV
jgi:hypothetical protein